MEWFYPKRRGPEWKHGWTNQTITSMSLPPFHLLSIIGIVVVLLWLTHVTNYKSQAQQTAFNFQVLLILLPLVLIVLFMVSYSSTSWFSNNAQLIRHEATSTMLSSASWGLAVFVVLLLVMISYQSSFHSKWFGPLRTVN